jgi:hypothetical protein
MSASEQIDNMIAKLPDWRGKKVTDLRELKRAADPGLKEEWKWGTAVWTKNGLVVAVGAFKDHVKVNFFEGAQLKDSKRLFNAGLDSKASRAIDIREGEKVDGAALKDLVKQAAALNKT